jgi:hypothetical protein
MQYIFFRGVLKGADQAFHVVDLTPGNFQLKDIQ